MMFGQYLIEKNVISARELDEALRVQEFSRQKIGRALKSLGFVDENTLNESLIGFLKIGNEKSLLNINAKDVVLDKIVIETQCVGYLLKTSQKLFLKEYRDSVLEEIEKSFQIKIVSLINDDQFNFLESLEYQKTVKPIDQNKKLTVIGPFDKFLSSTFDEAKRVKASDVHFDVEENGLVVRLRINGDLVIFNKVEKSHIQALMTKVRSEVGLPLSVVGKPASGSRFIEQYGIKVRAEYSPEILGETIVCRIIDSEKIKSASLETIDADEIFINSLKKSLKRKNGLILLCGQTGSGKSLTLFSSLMSLDRVSKKIITIEDPVEYEGIGLTQIDVNKNKMTFSEALRSSLRLDPDIIMVGEIRDEETAHLAMRAASTGHLVLSTLHTNSAMGAISRLKGMGVDESLLLENIIQISALTLKKRLCSCCKREKTSWNDSDIEKEFESLVANGVKFYEPSQDGCEDCVKGFTGRKLLTETIDAEIIYSKIFSKATPGYRTLLDCAKECASHGVISPNEAVGL